MKLVNRLICCSFWPNYHKKYILYYLYGTGARISSTGPLALFGLWLQPPIQLGCRSKAEMSKLWACRQKSLNRKHSGATSFVFMKNAKLFYCKLFSFYLLSDTLFMTIQRGRYDILQDVMELWAWLYFMIFINLKINLSTEILSPHSKPHSNVSVSLKHYYFCLHRPFRNI